MIIPEHLSTLLHWVAEREAIRIKKEAGQAPPWTTDPILGNYRFCNVRREDDKVTRWIDVHLRKPFAHSPQLPAWLAMGRFLNLPDTLQSLLKDPPFIDGSCYDPLKLYNTLNNRKDIGVKNYNAAYIISPAGTDDKNRYVAYRCVAALGFGSKARQFREELARERTLANAYTWLRKQEGYGEFMAYQILIDMRHTPLLASAPDACTFMAYGPGTRRGLNRLYGRDLRNKSIPLPQLKAEAEEVFHLIQHHSDHNWSHLEMSDIANILCEVDKYMRGAPKQRYVPVKELSHVLRSCA